MYEILKIYLRKTKIYVMQIYKEQLISDWVKLCTQLLGREWAIKYLLTRN